MMLPVSRVPEFLMKREAIIRGLRV
jgi:hypothetical protein